MYYSEKLTVTHSHNNVCKCRAFIELAQTHGRLAVDSAAWVQ